MCGCQAVQVHHRDPKSRGGSNDDDNLVDVCWQCHATYDDVMGKVPSRSWGKRFAVAGNVARLLKKNPRYWAMVPDFARAFYEEEKA